MAIALGSLVLIPAFFMSLLALLASTHLAYAVTLPSGSPTMPVAVAGPGLPQPSHPVTENSVGTDEMDWSLEPTVSIEPTVVPPATPWVTQTPATTQQQTTAPSTTSQDPQDSQETSPPHDIPDTSQNPDSASQSTAQPQFVPESEPSISPRRDPVTTSPRPVTSSVTYTPTPAAAPTATSDASHDAVPDPTLFTENGDAIQSSPYGSPEFVSNNTDESYPAATHELSLETPEVPERPAPSPEPSVIPTVASSIMRFFVTASGVPSSIPPQRVARVIATLAADAVGVDIQVGTVVPSHSSASRLLQELFHLSVREAGDPTPSLSEKRAVEVELLADVPPGSRHAVRERFTNWIEGDSWRGAMGEAGMGGTQLVVADTEPSNNKDSPVAGGETTDPRHGNSDGSSSDPDGKKTAEPKRTKSTGISLGSALGIASGVLALLAIISMFAVRTVRGRRHRDEPLDIPTAHTDALTQDDDCTGMDASESNYSVPSVRYSFARNGSGGENLDCDFAYYEDARPSDATSILTSSTGGVLRDSEEISAFGDERSHYAYAREYNANSSQCEPDIDPLPAKPRFADRMRLDY